MLRDNFFNWLFNSELRENGITRIVTNAPDAPEVVTQHADEIRGIEIDNNITGLARAEDETPIHGSTLSLGDVSRTFWDMRRAWEDIRPASPGLYYNTNTVEYNAPYTTIHERLDKLDKLETAIAEMISRREQAFRDVGCTDSRLIDYGHDLAELFRELYPDLYRNAIESAKHIQKTRITTEN